MHLRLMMEWKWGAGSVDGIDLATYYYCYCVHMICNHDLEWGGLESRNRNKGVHI